MMSRIKWFVPKSCLKTLYFALVNSHLNYGLLLWGHKYAIIESYQKRAIRVLTKSHFLARTDPIFKKEKILKIKDMYNLNCLSLFHRLKNDFVPAPISNLFNLTNANSHRYPTSARIRQSRNVMPVTYARTVSAENSLRYSLPRIVNNSPTFITDKCFTHSYEGFKNYIKNYFISLYDDSPCANRDCYSCLLISHSTPH